MTPKGDYDPEQAVLAHYGVKGMKWGVRRSDKQLAKAAKDRKKTEATTLSKEQRKEARRNVDKLSKKSLETKYAKGLFDRSLSEQDYKKLSKKDVTLRKGTELGRITNRKDEKLGDATYVSYKPNDRDIYRSVMPLMASPFKTGGNKRYKSTYEATYKNLDTLKSPSEKARVDAFTELFDTPSITLKNGKQVTGREYMRRMYPREVKTLNSQQLGLRFYNDFTENQFADTPINTAYFKSIRDKGYNSIVDDNDRGHLAEAPLIVLNPNGTLKKMNVKTLSADDINNAQRKLKVD